jgi:hypothetical protein
MIRRRLDWIALERAVNDAVEEAFWRVQSGPALPGALADAARQTLRSAGVEGAQVTVSRSQGGFLLDVRLPPGLPRVLTVRLRLDVG